MPNSYTFPLFAEIMHGALRPNLPQNADGKQFIVRLQDLDVRSGLFDGRYRMHYLRPFNPKTAWYEQLLLTEIDRFSHRMCEEVARQSDVRILAYLRDQILDKHLCTSLLRLGELIKDQQYRLEELEAPPIQSDRERLSAIYIYHLLKVCLAKAYLEVQHVLAGVVRRLLGEEELYLILAGGLPPERTFLLEVDPVPVAAVPVSDLTGFTYKFLSTYADDLRDLHDGLIKADLIAPETPYARFKAIFAGRPVGHPVVWRGNISDLFYFIKLLHNEYQAVEDMRQRQWEIACRCFVKLDGSRFDREKLRGQKKPVRTAEVIEQLVRLLEY